MSSISPNVQSVLQGRKDATQAQVDNALLGQQISALEQTGQAIDKMIVELVDVQKQLANGHIDVRV
jgi:hypothetical protein